MRVLLPHEILHSLADAGCPFLFESLLLGNLPDAARTEFWTHVSALPPWRNHPVLRNPDVDFSKLVGFTVHTDGAQMYREDEYFVWSVSSVFSSMGCSKDILLVKFPVAIIAERHMKSKNESCLVKLVKRVVSVR